ncbi:MAG: hypothetical protein V7K25_10795 [Nostoc sp.]|uniref:hypothetical protein n=1 Tax=Nostoc sp. TaxID=1180 RepID=UPI002FF9CB08
MKKISLYINILLIFFPAFSLSYPFTGIYFQSRILGLPFLIWYTLISKKHINKNLLVFILALLISLIIPVLGLLTNRIFSLMDIGYILSFLYLIVFAQAMGNNFIIFINFVKLFTLANIIYSILQTILMNIGLETLAMIHSNLPVKIDSGYVLPASILPYTFRFSGLFNESSPLIFYLCSSYIFLSEISSENRSKNTFIIQVLTLLTILISGSKYSYAFLINYVVIKLVALIEEKNLRRLSYVIVITLILYLFNQYFSAILSSMSETLPAFEDRKLNIENSINLLSYLDFLGNGFLPSSTGESGGLDAITIVVGGYGILFGMTILISFLIWILLSKLKNKPIFVVVYILGLLSSGSFLISQYTIFFTMIYVINKQYKISAFYLNDSDRKDSLIQS